MTTLTEEELKTLSGDEKQDVDFGTVTADYFVGHLTGVADTAKKLYEGQKLVLQGDVSGSTEIGTGNTSINVTVSQSKHADFADACGHATDSLEASHADLANIATFALSADKATEAEHSKESDHSLESDHALLSDRATNADHADLSSEAIHATDSDHALLSDISTVANKDTKNRDIADTIDDIIAKELSDTTTLQSAINDVNNVINSEIKVELDDHEQRINNIEITTDVGKVTERIIKIEELNTEQNTRLDNIDTLNTEQNTRLDNVETLASNTATTVAENKTATDNQITNLKLEDTALSNRIDTLNTTHAEDVKELKEKDTDLQEQINSLSERATGHDTSLGKLFTDLAKTNTNVQTNSDNISLNAQGIADNLASINSIKEDVTDLQAKTVDTSVSNKGIVQLTNDINGTEDKATTPKGVQTYVKDYVTDVTAVIARSVFEDIGIAGKKGFGQSACKNESLLKERGFRALQGTVDPDNETNYGVYEHKYGGYCCYIPKFWVRIGNENAVQYEKYLNNSIEVVTGDTFATEDEALAQGYFLPRAFIDGGEIKDGFFIQKYDARNSDKTNADGNYYPFSDGTGYRVSTAFCDMIDLAKNLGDNWNVSSAFMLSALQVLTLHQAQMADWYTWCKWYNPSTSYQYPTKGYSVSNKGLYSHNGMDNGICQWWYLWQFATGITTAGTSATQGQTAVTSNDIYILRKEKRFSDLTSGFGGDTDHWGTDESLTNGMYDKYTSPLTLTTNRTTYWGNTNYDVISNGINTDNNTIDELSRAWCGVLPKNDNATGGGINMMNKSYIYLNPAVQNMVLLFGGEIISSNSQGSFARLCYLWRTYSDTSLGFRCACYL